jgi:predicted RNA-binding Zn-ribbon protein involved in translation (DUF1610 family)
MRSEIYTDDCPSCGNDELVRVERPDGSTGIRLAYTRWTCSRCRFTWYTPLVVAPLLEQSPAVVTIAAGSSPNRPPAV